MAELLSFAESVSANLSTADPYLYAALVCAGIAGMYLERWRARRAKQRWLARQGIREQRAKNNIFRFPKPWTSTPIDAAEQLRIVMRADFEKRRLLSKSEARVLYAAEDAIRDAKLAWRVMAQVSLGEILSSRDSLAYAAINSKRVDILIISNDGTPIVAIEYQGTGHYQGSAAARDAVKKEALRKAGVRYIEVTPEHEPKEMALEILRIARSGAS